MISEPGRYVQRFREAGADLLTIHVEAVEDPRPLLREIRDLGAVAGLTLNPPTPIEHVEPYLGYCDLVLVMSVMAGFGGQEFEPMAIDRLRHLRAEGGDDLLLSVDGGVNHETIGPCAEAGADVFVTGSALFAHHDYRQAMEEFRGLALAHKNTARLIYVANCAHPSGGDGLRLRRTDSRRLDIPMNRQGLMEVARAVDQLRDLRIDTIYAAASEAAVQTADILSKDLSARFKKLDRLPNLNLGLWQGMQVGEVRHKQPKVYRQWQEQPENVCPPEGEMIEQADERIAAAMTKILRKHKEGVIGLVMPEPLASLVRRHFKKDELGDLWKALAGHGRWEILDLEPAAVPVMS